MQAHQPQGGSAEASTPRYDTIVIRGAQGKTVPKEVDGGEVVAWSRGHELAAMDALQEFVDDLAAGNCNQPTHITQGAADALNLMRRRRVLGWKADDPTESPPADWKTAVSQAEATVRKVFDGCDDETKDAIEYFAALMLACEPATQQVEQREPYAWFWTHGSDSGVLTVRQDYEQHKTDYPDMTFIAVYTAQGGAA